MNVRASNPSVGFSIRTRGHHDSAVSPRVLRSRPMLDVFCLAPVSSVSQNEAMRIKDWWSLLDWSTQRWLINNNGDVVPPHVLARITAVAGEPTAETSWVGDNLPDGFLPSDEAIDWIEMTANNEVADEEQPVRVGTVNQFPLDVGRDS